MRKPTYEELENGWRAFAYRVNFHRFMAMDEAAVKADLADLEAFVQSHSSHNGETTQGVVDKRITEAFWLRIAKTTPSVKNPAEPKDVSKRKPRKKDAA